MRDHVVNFTDKLTRSVCNFVLRVVKTVREKSSSRRRRTHISVPLRTAAKLDDDPHIAAPPLGGDR